jgi:hypothetical protein
MPLAGVAQDEFTRGNPTCGAPQDLPLSEWIFKSTDGGPWEMRACQRNRRKFL